MQVAPEALNLLFLEGPTFHAKHFHELDMPMVPGLVWDTSPTRDTGIGINIATPSTLLFGIYVLIFYFFSLSLEFIKEKKKYVEKAYRI